ncbi:hypothetical protein [Kordia jejudonensis]|uniref:hypothetical protein n=1 Tax=Kordia jejudonensis TaxID=1348245 RepID=UPI000629AE46|nr:hypothetical protein [Kordia jejudonensis]
MKLKLFLIIVSIALFSSCSSDDNTTNVAQHPIAGVWKMVNVTCECAPPNFQADHIWDFDLIQNKLTVTNEQDEILQVFETGVYDFVLNTETIILKDLPYEYFFENGQLFIGYLYHSDGPLMSFERQ